MYLFWVLCANQIRLVGENEHWNCGEVVFFAELGELGGSFVQSCFVGSIHDVHKAISVLGVVFPVWSDTLLSADVPHVELETILLQSFDVETLSWGGVFGVLVGQLFQDGRLASIIEAEDENTSLFVGTLEFAKECK